MFLIVTLSLCPDSNLFPGISYPLFKTKPRMRSQSAYGKLLVVCFCLTPPVVEIVLLLAA